MLNEMSAAGRGFIGSIIRFYRDTNFAYGIASVMTLVALLLVVAAILIHMRQIYALGAKLMQLTGFVSLNGAVSAGSADPKEAEFFRRFKDIDAVMRRGGFGGGRIGHAWMRYRKTLIVSQPPVRSTQRPNAFFYRAVSPPSWLGFSAQLFVGFGLLATFLGLVAALTFSSDAMHDASPNAMQDAVRDLLAAASSKFITSVAGVGLSLILRVVERILTASLRRAVDRLSASIELGVRVDPDAHTAMLAQDIATLLGRPIADAGSVELSETSSAAE